MTGLEFKIGPRNCRGRVTQINSTPANANPLSEFGNITPIAVFDIASVESTLAVASIPSMAVAAGTGPRDERLNRRDSGACVRANARQQPMAMLSILAGVA